MHKNKKYTVASLFSGMGGLDLGFEKAGFIIKWANEISPNAAKSYALNFQNTPICEDITKVSLDSIPSTDIVIGGPPCQAFSLVGKRREDDQRGFLVFRYLEIIQEKLPKIFVMENVPGLAASKIDGRRLTDILSEQYSKIGYNVNIVKPIASDYLVPQKRRRIFILGSLEKKIDMPNPLNFAEECYDVDNKKFDISAKAAIGDLGKCVGKGEMSSYSTTPISDFSKLMRSRNKSNVVSLHECPRMSNTDIEILKHIPPGGNYQDIPDAISPGRVLKFKKTGGRTTTYGRLHPDKPSYTINTYFRRPNVGANFHYSEHRLITAREAMRFQSFPDQFNLVYSSQDEKNSFIGNAVPPLLAHAIAWSVKNSLDG